MVRRPLFLNAGLVRFKPFLRHNAHAYYACFVKTIFGVPSILVATLPTPHLR